ncbi:exodeoxyribonuclease VII small subunit [bacterium]|jgi:exodeoxyribonuclease VII small subunit|nr:exodeoxyribonuclease VII small subunit [bacterium]NBW57748.1 exodeoxyribonuclease VII small subunit [bacterium]NBX71929.1 exodeoxyribonuclease VII small subunit [bacterium]
MSKESTPSIETMIGQLEVLATNLENGTMPFDEALNNYKQGLSLLDQCKRYLKQSKAEIKELHDQYISDEE